MAPSIAQSYGGPTYSLAGYIVASRLAGIDVTVASPRCVREDVDAFISRSGKTDLHLFRSVGSGAFVASPTLVRWVNRSAEDFDVVHVHGLFNSVSTLSARAAIGSPAAVVLRPFGTLSKYTFRHRRTAPKRAYFALLERKNLRGAGGLHFTSETERREADWHGVDFSGRAYVIPPPSLAHTDGRVSHDGDDGSRVLFVGRIDPIKNLESLLDAWLFVRRAMPSALLELAGEGDPDYVATLQRRAAMNGIASSVAFRGFASEEKKEKLLNAATLLVLPSHHENFGVVVLEALEAGVPVVVSPEVHLADFVRSEGVGKVAVANPPILAEAILSVLRDDEVKNRARDFGPSIVARNFSPAAIGRLLSEMYGAVLERKRASASN